MTFEELLDQACAIAHLPEMARLQLPSTLSDAAKKAVMKLDAVTLGSVLKAAIDQIDHGSVKSEDALVRKALEG